MGRIGKPPVSEGVGGQQIAELIVPAWLWNSENRNQSNSHCDNAKTHCNHGEPLPPRQAREAVLQPIENDRLRAANPAGIQENQRHRGDHQKRLDDRHQVRSEPQVKGLHCPG